MEALPFLMIGFHQPRVNFILAISLGTQHFDPIISTIKFFILNETIYHRKHHTVILANNKYCT